jgi:quercetin dioxygenase-like cupin family protein
MQPRGRNASADILEEAMSRTSAVPVVRRPGEGHTVPNPIAGDVVIRLTDDETGGAISMFESTPGPGAGPPMHVHAHEDEVLYVVDGTIRFKLGDEMHETAAGGFAFIPRGVHHAWQNVGSEPARVMFFFTPASTGMERFFPAFAATPQDGPVEKEFARLGREAGMEVVGPPLA